MLRVRVTNLLVSSLSLPPPPPKEKGKKKKKKNSNYLSGVRGIKEISSIYIYIHIYNSEAEYRKGKTERYRGEGKERGRRGERGDEVVVGEKKGGGGRGVRKERERERRKVQNVNRLAEGDEHEQVANVVTHEQMASGSRDMLAVMKDQIILLMKERISSLQWFLLLAL